MHTRSLLLLSAMALMVNACKKDEPGSYTPPPVPSVGNPIRSILQANVVAATQPFTINAAAGGTITAAGGSQIHFVPGAFVTGSGTPVTGTVNVEVVEVLDMGQMVWLNKQTVGLLNGEPRPLKSGGAIKIEARSAGAEMFLVPDGATLQLPTLSPDMAMQLFAGTEDADGNILWELRTDTVSVVPPDSTGMDDIFFYTATVDSLNWINCDYFPTMDLDPCMISTPEGFTVNNTILWLVLPALNSVMNVWHNGTLFGLSVPYGLEAIVVALHEDGSGLYHSSFTPITTAAGPFPLTFTPTTLEQFQVDLDGL